MNVDDCEKCGYRPRKSDAWEIEEVGIHVRCYNCGFEWVE